MATRPYRASDFPPLSDFPFRTSPAFSFGNLKEDDILLLALLFLFLKDGKEQDKTLPLLLAALLFL
ncbi:MAG: hypothetical protein II359_05130 [Clostridia bacterium]|nr:hypothetical protein [Clostridia bacterium]